MDDAPCPSQQQAPFFPEPRARDAQWPFAYIIARPSKSGFRQYPVIRTRVSANPPQREEPRATCDETRETAARDIHVEYVRDSNYGLCPAVMAMTVRRFSLGMTIDDQGGCASDFFLVSFFFSILYFLHCRHRFGGNENLIGGVFVHSDRPATTSTSRVQEREIETGRKRDTRDGRRGQAWTVWTYQPRADICGAMRLSGQ